MARFLKALCVLFIMLAALCGCEKPGENKSAVVTDFTADFTAEFNSMNIGGKITVNRQGMLNLSINSPEELNGIEIRYKGSELNLGREGLLCTADEAYLPDTAFSSIIRDILNRLSHDAANGSLKKSDNKISVSSTLGDCQITVDGEDKITSLECLDAGLSITFTNVVPI